MPLCNDATNLIQYKIQKEQKTFSIFFWIFAFLKRKNCVLHLQWRSKITEGGCPNDVNEVTGQEGKGDTKKFCCNRGQNVAMSINVSRLVTHSLSPLPPPSHSTPLRPPYDAIKQPLKWLPVTHKCVRLTSTSTATEAATERSRMRIPSASLNNIAFFFIAR